MPIEKIHWDKQDVVSCDERGRATLGTEFANEQVFVYIAETPDPAEGVRPAETERRVLSKMATWASDNVENWIYLNPKSGIVTDKHGEEHQSPYRYDEDRDEMFTELDES